MKLLLAIVRDECAADITYALNSAGMSVTRVSSTGGFWRRGYATLLIGVDESRVAEVLDAVDQHAGPPVDSANAPATHPPHRATVFVLNSELYAHY
jgi:uncharacterized protein YaaQ